MRVYQAETDNDRAQPIFELGQTSAKLLLDRIQFPEKEWEEKRLPVRLEKRFSTAPLK
ncbi:hypothetical protein [Staphylococcus aureus]|uniref:hypothetical protein n=1 Tax=Staphylococcus aureus TaxID=1280 RepID=UPI001EDE342E|nr:hypothetical protein [Staphylococcus aureus]